eukprot:1146490-Pelagomonas_calceolata.AAC.6
MPGVMFLLALTAIQLATSSAFVGYVNNQRENYNFRFNGIIGPEAKQDEVNDGGRIRIAPGCSHMLVETSLKHLTSYGKSFLFPLSSHANKGTGTIRGL